MGECPVERENIAILEKDLEFAHSVCARIENPELRSRAVAGIVAVRTAKNYFDEEYYQTDIDTGLYKVPEIKEFYDISDIYINGAYVDVRVYFSEDELSIPKSHFDTGMLPVAYMFVKVSPDLQNCLVTGFISPSSVNKSQEVGDYFFVKEDELVSIYDIEGKLHTDLDIAEPDDEILYRFFDGLLEPASAVDLLKQLVSSRNIRNRFNKIMKAHTIFNFVSKQKPVLNENNYVDLVSPISEEISSSTELLEEGLEELFTSEDGQNEAESEDNEYNTEITPSGSDILAELDNEAYDGSEIDSNIETPDDISDEQFNQAVPTEDSGDQIDELFTGEQEGVPVPKKKGGKGFFILLVIVLLSVSGGYFWYMNNQNQTADSSTPVEEVPDVNQQESVVEENVADAMPVETVESVKQDNNEKISNETIPAIEKSLDASVLVSNLKVYMEVPSGYVNNTSAQRYLVKLGKVIQLNLKTELLLLSKPPLSNKVTVELKFNSGTGNFEVVGITASSGEKAVDDLILDTLNKSLKLKLSANTDSFVKLQGNPILVINF